MIKFFSFVEGQKYIIKNIPQKFIQNNYFAKNLDGTYTVKVCGISHYKDSNYFFFPKGYDVKYQSSQKHETAKMLFQTLLKYKNSIILNEEESEWLGDENKDANFLDLVDWLIRDFQKNGLYVETEQKMELNGNGRIDWSRSIKQRLPFINQEQYIYLDMVTRKNKIDNNTIISLIHKKVIIDCIRNFSWLYDIYDSGEEIEMPISKEQQVIILKKKLQEIFVGHDIKLISSLIAYLETTKGKNLDFNLVTPYFYMVWEEMLQFTFHHDESLQGLVPKPYWQIKDEKQYTRQIPDILFEIKDELVIIDAKYYSISKGETAKYPGWESIVKQMYYKLSFNHIYQTIKNIFIMPQSIKHKSKSAYIGKTSVEGKEYEFGYIYAYSVDIDTVLKSYISSYYLDDILRIIFTDVNCRNDSL